MVKLNVSFETPVDLSSTTDIYGRPVDPVNPVTIHLPSQIIRKTFDGHLLDPRALRTDTDDIGVSDFIQLDVEDYILDEIEDKHTIPIINAKNDQEPQPFITFEEAGEAEMNFRYEISIVWYDSPVTCPQVERYVDSSENYIEVYIQINNETPIAFSKTTETNGSEESCVYTYSDTREFIVGDTIKVYAVLESVLSGFNEPIYIWLHSKNNTKTIQKPIVTDGGGGNCLWNGATEDDPISMTPPSQEEIPSRFYIMQKTVYPDTQAEGYLIHDAIDGVLRRIGANPLYSEFLGHTTNTSRTYSEDGCGWMYAIIKGLQLRGYSLTEKPFFVSMKDLWNGINPILNLAVGDDVIGGNPMTRIEPKKHFFEDTPAVNFSFVRDIEVSYDDAYIFKTIKTGYKQWQSENISGLDDPQTKQTRATILAMSGTDLMLESDFIAASLAIENTRRRRKEKTADYKFDNNNFIIALNTSELSPNVYQPELDENFTSITNLNDPETRYNSMLTPMRNCLRWANYWSGCLQPYLNSKLRFVSGEGNYDMISNFLDDGCERGVLEGALSEKQDIELTYVEIPSFDYKRRFPYLFLPMEIKIVVPMDKTTFLQLDRKKPIGISQTDSNHVKFYIKDMEYDIMQGRATIQAWPKTPFSLQVIEQEFQTSCSNTGKDFHQDDYGSQDYY